MSLRTPASLAVLLVLSAAFPATAAITQDQTYNPAIGSAAGYQVFNVATGNPLEQKVVQTFTAGLTGSLTSVNLEGRNNTAAFTPSQVLTLEIYAFTNVANGNGQFDATLTGSPLASSTVTATNTLAPLSFNFAAPLAIAAGEQYALYLHVATPGSETSTNESYFINLQTTRTTFENGVIVYTPAYAAGLFYFWNPSLNTFRHNASTASLRFTTFVDVPAPLPGDYNTDGYVDAADYTVWADHFGQTGAGIAGDGNNDHVVDAADYTIWADNFGAGTPPAGVTGAVPEPTSLALGAPATLLLARRRR